MTQDDTNDTEPTSGFDPLSTTAYGLLSGIIGTLRSDAEYDDVFITIDGGNLAVTDHESPMAGADVPTIATAAGQDNIVRAPVLESSPDAIQSRLPIEGLIKAIESSNWRPSVALEVVVDQDGPVVIEGEPGPPIGIAPVLDEKTYQQQVGDDETVATDGGVRSPIHVVCRERDCFGGEAIVSSWAKADRIQDAHERVTGHRAVVQRLGGGR